MGAGARVFWRLQARALLGAGGCRARPGPRRSSWRLGRSGHAGKGAWRSVSRLGARLSVDAGLRGLGEREARKEREREEGGQVGVGLKTIGNGRENAQTITVTIFFAGIRNGNENVGRKNETGITRYRERNIFNRERVDYDRESVTRKRNICRLTAMHNPYANKSITHKIIVL
jgi:hypothetical protein